MKSSLFQMVKLCITLSVIPFFCSGLLFAGSVPGEDEQIDQNIQTEIIETVLFANRLDEILWQRERDFDTKEKVLEHYRQCFSEELASMFTEYWWWDMKHRLLPGDPLMAPPQNVHLGKYNGDKAVAYYETPEILRDPDTWGLERYMIVELHREEDRWIIVRAMNTDKEPF